jgi:hypothetical protein
MGTLSRAATAVASALLLCLVASGPAGAASKRPSCTRAGSKTIAQNGFARVFERRARLYACRRSNGRAVRLATRTDELETSSDFSNVRLAGRFVAWVSSDTDLSCKAQCPPGYVATRTAIQVFDVRLRRRRAVAASPSGRALVLSRNGGVAWATQAAAGGTTEVRGSVRAGDDRLFDSGAIDPASLGIEITIVSWVRDGVERFARLR